MSPAPRLVAPEPSFAELFTPKLVTVLCEGYGARQLRADAVAGLKPPLVRYAPSVASARMAARHEKVEA